MSMKHRKPLFKRLKTGLQECIAHAQGERNLKTTQHGDRRSENILAKKRKPT